MKQAKRIILSRTDSIGDVVLTLPMAGAIKKFDPNINVLFLGSNYTKEVVSLSGHVDGFLNWDEIKQMPKNEQINYFKGLKVDAIVHVFPNPEIAKIAANAKIPVRIGSTGRLYHYLYCNKLVPLSRKHSALHEAQLNFKLLQPITGIDRTPSLEEIARFYGFKVKNKLDNQHQKLLDSTKFNLILHPKSKGSAREWPLDRFAELIRILPQEHFKIFVTGTEQERGLMNDFLEENRERLTDLTGAFSLVEFIRFIDESDGLIAASTGPLHLAAALGKLAIGIYPPIKPMHPGRWAPLGKNAHFVVLDKNCSDCWKSGNCHCMEEVNPEKVKNLLLKHD